MDQHERRRAGVTELDVENLHLGRISAARTPREVLALVTPRVCSIHGAKRRDLNPIREGSRTIGVSSRATVSVG